MTPNPVTHSEIESQVKGWAQKVTDGISEAQIKWDLKTFFSADSLC